MTPLTLNQANADSAILLAFFGCFAVFALITLGLFVWSMVWVYGDAEARGKSGIAVALLVALISWPLSLLVWLVARPDIKSTADA